MERTKRGARWLLGMVCAVAVSCADSPTAVAPDGDAPGGLDALATHAAGSNANGRGQLASVTTGTPAHANGNGNVKKDDSCAVAVEPAASDSLLEEAAPADVCAIARYLPNAPSPGRQMVSAFIDENGGSLRLGDFEIIVPAGAVDRPTRFAIMLPPPGHGDRAYAEFRPHNQQFAVPVTIRLPHAITDAEPGAPVTWWSQNGKTWVDQPTTTTTDGRIETQVDHFSFYGTRALTGITIAGG